MMRAFLNLILLVALSANATDFYVDSARTSNGDGSQTNPWKLLSDIDWVTVSNATLTATTTLYLSSRGTWSPGSQVFTPQATGNSSFRFTISGDGFYNLAATGTANWIAETTGSRATLSGGANFALANTPMHDFTLRGLYFDSAIFSAIFMLPPGPFATNVWNVSTYNCACAESTQGHGYAGDNMVQGCSNIVVSGCQFTNTLGEGIYMGFYAALSNAVPGIVVESNVLVNCGVPGHEGDIDIKPPCVGAIVRYNQHFNTQHSTDNRTACGVVIGADQCQVYGNIFHSMDTNGFGSWGNGIFINADGDGATGKSVTSCLVYNNLIYDCAGSGINMTATTATTGADISGVKFWNNTLVGNWRAGFGAGTSAGRTITIASFTNNLIAGSTGYDVTISSGVTMTADNNLYFRASGVSWSVSGTDKTWAQWQALGFDAHGLNANPLLNSDYTPTANSPARGTGANLISLFTTDLTQKRRTEWDIGAYEYGATANITQLNVGILIVR